MRATVLGIVLVAACGDEGTDAPPVVRDLDPLAYGPAGATWMDDVQLDLGDRSDGAPSRVNARVHLPERLTGPAEVVIFAHDAQVRNDQYLDTANHLASHGLVVVLPQFDTARERDGVGLRQDLIASMDAVVDALATVQGIEVDTSAFALAGHGRGGRQAMLAGDDPRVKVVFALDPIDGDDPSLLPGRVGRLTAPLGLTGAGRTAGEGGCVEDGAAYGAIFDAAPAGTTVWEAPTGGHHDVVDDCADGGGAPICSTCPSGDAPERSARHARASLLAWVALHLQGEEGYRSWADGVRAAEYLPDAAVRTR